MDPYRPVIEQVGPSASLVMMIGGLDSGKSTLGRALAFGALQAHRPAAYLDADLGQKVVGPPAAVTLRMLARTEDLRLEAMSHPDSMHFVGATTPQGQLLPLVVGVAQVLARARGEGAEFVVIDTSPVVSGVYGQLLNYHMVELLQPDVVIGLQRGEELEPVLGILRRFFPCEVLSLPVDPDLQPASVEERARRREDAFRRYFVEPLHRWRVKPTVFMPSLPALFDEEQLDRVLVGLSDGKGHCIGLGYLEHSRDDQVLRLVSPVAEGPKALRLGSVKLDEGFRVRRIDLRNLFGTD